MVFCVAGLATGRRDTALAAVTIQLEPVLTAGLDRPLYVTHAHDGSNRLFIVEQPGRIKVLQPGATSAETFLDITSLVTRSVVLHQGVRLKDVRADLAAEIDILLGSLFGRTLLVTLSPLEVVQARPQDLHCHVPVAVL